MITPQPGPQTEFVKRLEDECMYGGAKGGGKSFVLLIESLRQVNNPNYKALILRRTYPRLQELIDRSKLIFPKLGASYSGQEHTWTFPTGSKIRFGHCQNVGDEINYQGHEYQYLGFDQLEEFLESQYLFLSAQVRTSDPTLRCYVRSTANPGGIGHAWVKARWIDNKQPYKTYTTEYDLNGNILKRTSAFIPATVYDNKILLDANPQYLATLSNLPERNRKALLEGSWDIFEGQYFSEFDRATHVVKPFSPPLDWKRVVCGDYGYTAPSAIYWAAISPTNDLYIYRELYATGLTYSALADEIKKYTAREEVIDNYVFDPSIWAVHGSTGETGSEIFFQKNLNVTKGDNSRVAGWMRMREFLKDSNGKPHLFISESCVNLIRTLPALVYDKLNVEDVDSHGDDHAPDAIRYLCMSRPRPNVKEVDSEAKYIGLDSHTLNFRRSRELARLDLQYEEDEAF